MQIQRAVPMDGTSLSNRRGQWRLVERTIPHPLWTGRGLAGS